MTRPAPVLEDAAHVSSVDSFKNLIAPFQQETFLQKYVNQQPLHIPGNAGKFSNLMSFEKLNNLLSVSSFWSSQTLQLVADAQMIDPRFYCAPTATQNGTLLRPSCEKVMDFLRQGASLVCNDINSFTPELRAVHRLLSETFQAKVQANMYVSWQQKRAFKSHFDTHDVWAFHCVGEKVWQIYKGRADHPLPHPSFKNFGQAHHDLAKGELAFEVTLKPGDILYIPRGFYHDALASSAASIHVTFGVTRPVGLDLLSLLFEQAISSSFFRQNVPQQDQYRYLKQFEKECARLIASDDFKNNFSALCAHFATSFPEYQLPEAL